MEQIKQMQELTEEQKQYFDLKRASDNMIAHYTALRRAEKIPKCIPYPKEDHYIKFAHEKTFYLFMECLEGKHNDFLQTIIDTSTNESK